MLRIQLRAAGKHHAAGLLFALSLSCDGGGATGPDQSRVAGVTVSPPTAALHVRATQQMTALVKDVGGNVLTGRSLTWSSSSTAVATVSSAGVVTAVAPGTATITATSEGKSGSAIVTVTPVPVATIEINPATAALHVGGTQQLTVVLKDADGAVLTGRAVAWASSDAAVATVNSAGLVTAMAPGTATITATSEGKSGSAIVTVTPVPVATIEINPATAALHVGGTQQLAVVLKDADGAALTGRAVTWASSDAAVATVNSAGLVTAMAPGTATITATSEGKSGSASVTVTPVPVATIEINPATAALHVGGTQQLAVVLKDADGAVLPDRPVTWASSDAAVATVSSAGVVTAVAPGTATLTATREGKTGSASVSVSLAGDVTAPSLVSLSFAPTTVDITNGAATTVATLRVTDAGSGVRVIHVELRSPSHTSVSCNAPTRISGDAADGVYTCPLTIPQGASPGSWPVRLVQLFDAVGNIRNYEEAQASAYSAGINVTSENITPVPVATVEVIPGTAALHVGGTQQLTVVLKDANGEVLTDRAVTYASSDAAVATVSSAGVATAVAPGTATITATSEGKSGGASVTVTLPPPTTGLTVSVTSPVATNEFLIAVDGGAFGTSPQVSRILGASTTSGTLPIGVPAGGPYRVRVVAVDPRGGTSTFPLMSVTGRADGVTVTDGALSPVAITLAAPTFTINAPASVAPGDQITITWTITDPGASLVRPTLDGRLHYGTAPFSDLTSTQVHATASQTSATTFAYSATFTAPTTPGTLYYQVVAQTFDLTIPGTSRAGWLISPSAARAEPHGEITVAPPTTGLTVSVASPVATNELLIAVDGGAFGATPQVSRILGTSMTSGTLTIGVPLGGPYRVRVVAVDPRGSYSTFPLMSVTGRAEGVTVSDGALSPVAITLAAPTFTINAPAAVAPGEQVTITWTISDPGASLVRPAPDGRLHYGTASFTDLTSTQLHATASQTSATTFSYSATFTAPTTPGTLYYQVVGQTFNLTIPGTSRAGWLISPSTARSEPPGQIIVR